MPKSLVTGGAGFLGSHVAQHLLDAGHEVIALDDLSGGFIENVPLAAEFVNMSITDHDALAWLFAGEQFDYVFHLAAYAAEGLSHFIRHYNYTNNLLGSVNLINESVKHDVARFVFTSSIAVYGTNQVPMREDMIPAPEDPYGIAKHAVERDLHSATMMFGLPFTIFRPHNVYGERQHLGDRYRNVVGIFCRQLAAGQPMTVFGDGSQSRAFSHVDDVAPVIARCIDVPHAVGETFNIGADQPCTVMEVAHLVGEAWGDEYRINLLPARYEVEHAFTAHDKARQAFDLPEPIALEDGIARMVAWAKKQPAREPSSFGAIEVEKNLPSFWQS